MTEPPRVPLLERAEIGDASLRAVVDQAEVSSAPKPEWYLLIGHAPEVAVAYHRFWNLTYRGGTVEHTTKELMRVTITSMLSCTFCSTQRSAEALDQGLDEEEIAACTAPSYKPGDARVAAAIEYARALATDITAGYDGWDAVYHRLRAHYSDAEVAELICLCANTIGGTLVARTLNLPTSNATEPVVRPNVAAG